MPPGDLKDKAEKDLESLGEALGRRFSKAVSRKGGDHGGAMGKKAAKALVHQVERLHHKLDTEAVTKKEQLGIGGKIGTGLGILGKHFIEKRHPLMREMSQTENLVSHGRELGAKGEKILKKGLKKSLMRMTGGKRVMGKGEEGTATEGARPGSRKTGGD